MKFILGLNGTTITDLALSKDAIFYALLGVKNGIDGHKIDEDKHCNSFKVINTDFQGYNIPENKIPKDYLYAEKSKTLKPFWEIWTVAGCKYNYELPIYFLPDTKGIQISVGAKDFKFYKTVGKSKEGG